MDFDVLRKFYAFKKTSFYIILITIFLSIVEDTVVGILVGTVLALLIFLKRVTNADLNITVFRNNKFFHKGTLGVYLKHHQDPEDIVIVKLFGEINYLNSETYLDQIKKVKACKMVVFSFSQLSDIDIDGTEILEQVFNHMAHKKIPVYVTGLQEK